MNEKNEENQGILQFLQAIGVDVRFISLWNNHIFINNLKFSRFSRKKEELFQAKHPDGMVLRSKIFQKVCIRASRALSKSLSPQDKIFVKKDGNCADLALYVILESYKRKYGIEIIYGTNIGMVSNYLKEDFDSVDSIASPITLDVEAENIIDQMFQGKKITLMSSNTKNNGTTFIYPLINIPQSWIESWAQTIDLPCDSPRDDGVSEDSISSRDLINFLEEFIPNVRENMLKSALFISN